MTPNGVEDFLLRGSVVEPAAAVSHSRVVLPMKSLVERRPAAPGPAQPTQVELLAENRDLLRAQQGAGPVQGTAGSLQGPAASL